MDTTEGSFENSRVENLSYRWLSILHTEPPGPTAASMPSLVKRP
jgi:hypothetical protein